MSDGSISSFASNSSASFANSDIANSSPQVSVVLRETPLEDALNAMNAIWSYTLTVVDGSAITIGKIVLAILLIVLGLYSSRWLSRLLVRGLLRKTSLHSGAAHAFQSISFYFFVSAFTLGALDIVHIPLTVFTLLGGALAIGVGFGSQNLASNFISGIILLFEQPVRVGDIIEVDGVQGDVLRIGLRSTLVRTPSNLDVVVPNNSLLDRKIINWTLSDSTVRRTISMGIGYTANVRQVEQLLVKLAAAQPEVLAAPAPLFFLVNFGTSALDCELRFWMSGRSIGECLRVESNLRIAILSEFASHGISLPFPPLELRKVGL